MWKFSKITLIFIIQLCTTYRQFLFKVDAQTATISINASPGAGKKISETMFGIFFEEINHAGAGGLWAELVSNRGFEAGGQSTPSNIYPWSIIGDESVVRLSTERSSCFPRNKVALRVDVLCDPTTCPAGGVGVYNPGYWGMNIEQGKAYKVILYLRSLKPAEVSLSLTSSNGTQTLASATIKSAPRPIWTRAEVVLTAQGTDHYARLQLTTTSKGVIWFDQVSAMPIDTYKGHGFRSDLYDMLVNLQPRFLRFPGGTYIEGNWLMNAYRWKETIGPWEKRPGHWGDVWNYWSDDGIGFLEYLQLAEDLNTLPIWVFNNGIGVHDQVNTSMISPFVQEVLDGIEFARGDPSSKWGSLRAKLGHPKPFDLRYLANGNEECGFYNYRGNYLKFYDAIKRSYPDIQIITNCDASNGRPLDHSADLYDFHIYTNNANDMFNAANKFDRAPRTGPKAFVSEYASRGTDGGTGSLIAALGEAAFVIGIERNSDAVSMASYAPLFVNTHDRAWNPDSIVFDAYQHYGTPSYWMQTFFIPSSGATLLNSTFKTTSNSLMANAINYQNSTTGNNYLKIKVVNFGNSKATLNISISGLGANSIQPSGSIRTVLTANNPSDENSFAQPSKIVPVQSSLENAGNNMAVTLVPHSFTSFDLLLKSIGFEILGKNTGYFYI